MLRLPFFYFFLLFLLFIIKRMFLTFSFLFLMKHGTVPLMKYPATEHEVVVSVSRIVCKVEISIIFLLVTGLLPVTVYSLLITFYLLLVASYSLLLTSYSLLFTIYSLLLIIYMLLLILYSLLFISFFYSLLVATLPRYSLRSICIVIAIRNN